MMKDNRGEKSLKRFSAGNISISALLAILLLVGCAGHRGAGDVGAVSVGETTLRQTDDRGGSLQGLAELRIVSSIKTHCGWSFSFGSCNHGTDEFSLVVDLDGKVQRLQATTREENLPLYAYADPEAGRGMRYVFSESLRLKPGKHLMKISIPDDDLTVEKEVVLKEGVNQLEVVPVYGLKNGSRRVGFPPRVHFTGGIQTLKLLLDGEEV